jgi:hypothetical protein
MFCIALVIASRCRAAAVRSRVTRAAFGFFRCDYRGLQMRHALL